MAPTTSLIDLHLSTSIQATELVLHSLRHLDIWGLLWLLAKPCCLHYHQSFLSVLEYGRSTKASYTFQVQSPISAPAIFFD